MNLLHEDELDFCAGNLSTKAIEEFFSAIIAINIAK